MQYGFIGKIGLFVFQKVLLLLSNSFYLFDEGSSKVDLTHNMPAS